MDELTVLKSERWEPRLAVGVPFFVGRQPYEELPFDTEEAAAVFRWLLAHPELESGNTSRPTVTMFLDFLSRFGAVTRVDRLDSIPATSRIEASLVAQIAELQGPSATGEDDGDGDGEDDGDGDVALSQESLPLIADFARLLQELVRLRASLLGALDWQRHGAAEALATGKLLSRFHDDVETSGRPFGPEAILRAWVVAQVNIEGLRPVVIPSPDGSPARVGLVPSSPVQWLWLILAVTVGALEPPFETPGVHQCDYCDEIFVADRSGVRGTHVFCSERHGKSYYAARRMREKRAQARERRSDRSETD